MALLLSISFGDLIKNKVNCKSFKDRFIKQKDITNLFLNRILHISAFHRFCLKVYFKRILEIHVKP